MKPSALCVDNPYPQAGCGEGSSGLRWLFLNVNPTINGSNRYQTFAMYYRRHSRRSSFTWRGPYSAFPPIWEHRCEAPEQLCHSTFADVCHRVVCRALSTVLAARGPYPDPKSKQNNGPSFLKVNSKCACRAFTDSVHGRDVRPEVYVPSDLVSPF